MSLEPNEVLIILLVALVVLGPRRLPTAARKIGEAYRHLRRVSASVKAEFDSAVEEVSAPLRDVSASIGDAVADTRATLHEELGGDDVSGVPPLPQYQPADELGLGDDLPHDRGDDR